MTQPIQYQNKPLSLILNLHNEGTSRLWIWRPLWDWGTSTSIYMDYADYLPNENTIKPPEKPPVLPVILACTIPALDVLSKEKAYTVSLNPLPLPQQGEYALIAPEYDATFIVYHIQQLPLEVRQRWVELGEKILNLSLPLEWGPFTGDHLIAADEKAYQQQRDDLARLRHLDDSLETRASVYKHEARLTAAYKQLKELNTMLNKEHWLEQWEEIKGMMHDLTSDYYEYHQQQQQRTDILPSTSPSIEKQKKKPRKRNTELPTIVAKDKEEISLKSDALSREIINALRDKTTYQVYETQRLAEHKHKFNKDKGSIIISISPSNNEGFETVLHALNTLGDGCVDTYIAIMAMAIDKNGTEHIRTSFHITPDDILAICKKEKSNGSYTPYQRADVIKHIKTLSQARVIATMPGKPAYKDKRGKMHEATVYRAEGVLVELLSFKIGEYKLITGEEIWEKHSIIIGEWVTMIPDFSKKTATMLRQVLAYSAKNQRYQKRLGIYLTFMFRINAYKGSHFEVSMGKLLEGAGIIVRRQRSEFKMAIENALAQLKQDNVIGYYGQIVDSHPSAQKNAVKITAREQGWWDIYANQMWRFCAPEHTKEQYLPLLKLASGDNAEEED